jgi:hypothetical protein
VLACGGIETTGVLLAHQRDNPLAFGGTGGPLGRYYMGHISGKVANIVLRRPDDVRCFDSGKRSDVFPAPPCAQWRDAEPWKAPQRGILA